MNEAYPKRPKFFAFKFCRLLAKKTVANEIGAPACWLLAVIAHTEDARGYTDPVTFYNEQLLPLVGAGSVDALDRVRDKCVKAGWLHYEPGGRSRAGRYWVTVPNRYTGTDDAPTDEGDEPDSSQSLFRENAEVSAERTARKVRKEPRGKCGTLSPVPFPIPVAAEATAAPTPEKEPKPKKPRQPNPLFDALAEVTGSDPVVNGSHIGRVAALLSKAEPPYTADDVRAFAARWRELLPWANPTEHPRLSLGTVEKYLSQLRAAAHARPATDPPRIKSAADNPRHNDTTDYEPMGVN